MLVKGPVVSPYIFVSVTWFCDGFFIINFGGLVTNMKLNKIHIWHLPCRFTKQEPFSLLVMIKTVQSRIFSSWRKHLFKQALWKIGNKSLDLKSLLSKTIQIPAALIVEATQRHHKNIHFKQVTKYIKNYHCKAKSTHWAIENVLGLYPAMDPFEDKGTYHPDLVFG